MIKSFLSACFRAACVFSLLSVTVSAQSVPQEEIFPELTGNELLQALVSTYSPDVVLNYNNARDEMFTVVDNESGTVTCIFTGYEIPISPTDPTPRSTAFNLGFNTEHIWPQSKGAADGPARSDIHHLRPIRIDVNNSRANFPFTFIEPENVNTWWKDDINQTTIPEGDLGLWSRTGSGTFEVRDFSKGFTARAMFYFFTFYNENALAADPDYFAGMMQDLRDYHNFSEVTEYEYDRMMAVEGIQGNVNPFIADTTLVRRAFFENFDPDQDFSGEGYFVDFEDVETPGGYSVQSIEIDDIQWEFSNTLIGTDDRDIKIGQRAARMRWQTGAGDNDTYMEMTEDLEGGLGTVSFLYARSNFSGDRSPAAPQFVVEYSINQGEDWSQLGDAIDLDGVDELTTFSESINLDDDGRIRIRAISGSNGRRFNIDNLRITGFSSVTLASLGPLSAGNITSESVDMSTEILDEGGGEVTERGFLWSEIAVNSDPILGDPDISTLISGSGTGTFSETISGLEPSTEYVIKGYAINEAGVAYNEEVYITTAEEPVDGEGITLFQDTFGTSFGAGFTTDGEIGSSGWLVNRSGADWGARIHNDRLELTNSASTESNAQGWVYAYRDADVIPDYNPVLEENDGMLSWSFNMRQIRTNPAGFAGASYGAAFVIGSESADVRFDGNGYAVVLGNSGTPDPVRFVKFENGLESLGNSSDGLIVAQEGSALEDPQNDYMSIRVTYLPGLNEWRLYGRVDGSSSFENPLEGELELIGSVSDNTFTGDELSNLGAYWNGSFANNQTAFFDNVRIGIQPFDEAETLVEGMQAWRMVSPPLHRLSFAGWLEPFWLQGAEGGNVSHGAPNLFSLTSGSEYTAVPNYNEEPEPGAGYLFFVYEDDEYDSGTGSFPKNWPVKGFELSDDVTIDLNPEVNHFTLVGNPYSAPLDFGAVISANPGVISDVIYVYDHTFNGEDDAFDDEVDIELTSGGYRAWNGSAGGLGGYVIAPFQAVLVETLQEDAQLTIPASAMAPEEDPEFYRQNDDTPLISFSARINGKQGATVYVSLGEDAQPFEPGPKDIRSFYPLDYRTFAHLALSAGSRDEMFMLRHLPENLQDVIELPLHFSSFTPGEDGLEPNQGEANFSWNISDAFPAGWEILLHDNELGTITDLRADSSLVFVYNPGSDKSTEIPRVYADKPRLLSTEKTAEGKEERWTLEIIPSPTSADGESDLPQTFALEQNYPNPFNPTTSIRYKLPEAADVRLDVYSVLGQRVASLVNSRMEAGSHQVSFDASSLSSGVYIYRLQAGDTVLTRKMMLIK